MTDELNGTSVLVTRPSHQADNLVRLIESHGGEALRFPSLEIEANTDRDSVLASIGDVAEYDIAIFISINAVTHGVQYLPTGASRPQLAAIGPSTARALAEAGFKCDIKATRGFTSEALLREPAFVNVAGKKIIIFRGIGGRALLGRELEQRGAQVTYAEVYRRDRPDVLDSEIESRLAAGTVDVVTATSAETLFNLYELATEPSVTELMRTQLVTTSERVVKKAAALGFETEALLAAGPDDQAVVDAILNWRRSGHHFDSVTGTTMTEPTVHEPTKSMDPESIDDRSIDNESIEDESTMNMADDANNAVDTEMNEDPIIENSTRETEAAVVVPVKRQGGALSLLAMLLSLAALAAAGYLWWEQRQAVNITAESQSATGNQITSTQQQIAVIGDRLDQSLSRVSTLDASRGRVESKIDDLRSSVETLTARVQGAEQSIDAVSGVSASVRGNWVRAETEYFLQAANSRLQLAGDPDGALAALQAADDRLKSLGDPTLYRVRQELAGEISALKAVPRPDMEGIAHSLNGLAARVEQLPLNSAPPTSYQAPADTTDPATQSPTERATATFKRMLSSVVSVKRTDEDVTPLLSHDEEFFLRRNLELQLQTARLALLRGEPANYRESLRTARNWVQAHFMKDAPAVQSAIATLTELEAEDIAPGLPDISGSLRLLRLSKPADVSAPAGNPPSQPVLPADDAVDDPVDSGDDVAGEGAETAEVQDEVVA